MTTTDTASADPWVERYVAAVAARLPADQRTDVAEELRASILDSVEDRLEQEPGAGGRSDREHVVRRVLVELGDPAVLARGYASGPRHLIGPDYYDTWRTLLVTITLFSAPITALVALVTRIWADDPVIEAVLGSLWTGLTVAIQVAFWVTLTFWVVERSGTPVGAEEEWTPDRLPPLPRPRVLGLQELLGGLGLVALVLAWLLWQHVRSPVDDAEGDRVPLLDPDLWSSGWLWGLVALLVAMAVVEVAKYRAGDWTASVTVAVVVLDLLTAGYLVLMLTTQTVVNPALVSDAETSATADWIVLLLTTAVVAVGIGEAVRGHLRQRGRVSPPR